MLNTFHTLSYLNFTLSPRVRYNYFLNLTEEETETENNCHNSLGKDISGFVTR